MVDCVLIIGVRAVLSVLVFKMVSFECHHISIIFHLHKVLNLLSNCNVMHYFGK